MVILSFLSSQYKEEEEDYEGISDELEEEETSSSWTHPTIPPTQVKPTQHRGPFGESQEGEPSGGAPTKQEDADEGLVLQEEVVPQNGPPLQLLLQH